jgi:hypothetical protein
MVMRVSTELLEDEHRASVPEMFGWAIEEPTPLELLLDRLTKTRQETGDNNRALLKGEQLL